jgi:hypothetical protein
MPISFVGSKTFAAAGAASGTFSVSLADLEDASGGIATLAENDLVIICYVAGGTANNAYSPPTGYTEDAELYGDDGNDVNLCAWRKVMGATPDTTVSIPNSGDTVGAVAGTILALRGISTSTPVDVTVTTATGGNTGQPNPASITPSTAGAYIVVLGGSGTNSETPFTNPGDLSSTTNHFRSVGSPDSRSAVAGCGIKTDWSSGAFDPSQWAGGDTSITNSWAAVTYAIRPSGAVYSMVADTGAFTLTGPNATMYKGTAGMSADTGVFTLTGPTATFRLGWVMVAEPGVFALSVPDTEMSITVAPNLAYRRARHPSGNDDYGANRGEWVRRV